MVGVATSDRSSLDARQREMIGWRSGVRWATLAGGTVEGMAFRRLAGIGAEVELVVDGAGEGSTDSAVLEDG